MVGSLPLICSPNFSFMGGVGKKGTMVGSLPLICSPNFSFMGGVGKKVRN
jgi:hypothetical protein